MDPRPDPSPAQQRDTQRLPSLIPHDRLVRSSARRSPGGTGHAGLRLRRPGGADKFFMFSPHRKSNETARYSRSVLETSNTHSLQLRGS